MNVTKKIVSAALLICLAMISAGSVAAINGYQNGDLDREQLKEGSCYECFDTVTDEQQDMLQERTQSQLKDGSCSECVEPVATQQQDMLQKQTRDQLKDGSCGECVNSVTDEQQDRLQ